MFPKGKGSTVPSDSQAREKLALYVYEYLLHVGAQKTAQTFLSEIRWEKNITLGEPPGFLHSWWCVFWDLYCAAPERRETCEHSSEAKAFHDYSAAGPNSVMGQIPQGADGMPGGPMPGFFQSSPHHNPNMMDGNQPFMSPRYPGGPRGPVRMPGNQPAVGVPNSQAMMQSIDPSRQPGHIMGPRMNHPRMPMNPNYGGPGMRGPLNSMPGGMPMSMPGGRPWNPNAASGPPGGPGGGPPGTPIMPSPQDSSNSGDSMFSMMKSVPGGAMGPGQNFPMNSGPDGPMPMGSQDIPPVMNGEMDGMPKSSPASNPPGGPGGPGTPREDNGSMTPQMFPPYAENCPQDQNESAAILKIKETMQEEAKRFEKDTPGPDHPEYFMQ
ncbi:single-stranded DNA-binding protein 3-like isoform X1 [Lytechinus pictus]|uniref:single-stranded DNA-binding protein 3-like isoform X1 n=1 Tax=Lytechinus variegatus TaxID=7654 RepID=UPI001BB151DF|nr:single-stranded DNA-binding protein 3-like isoform X1 [Lytechinus variegatus]